MTVWLLLDECIVIMDKKAVGRVACRRTATQKKSASALSHLMWQVAWVTTKMKEVLLPPHIIIQESF